MKKGVATLIAVFLVAMIGVFVVTAWQARLYLAIHRSQSLADSLIVGYLAESRINDLVAKFLGNYPQAFSFPFHLEEQLPDGSLLVTDGTHVGNIYTMDVVAQRQFATTNMRLIKEENVETEALYDQVDMIINLDCSGSMNTLTSAGTTRLREARDATWDFANAVEEFNALGDLPMLRLGLASFGITNKWVQLPTADMTRMKSVINDQIRDRQELSGACQGLNTGGTNIGGGYKFMSDYFVSAYPPVVERLKKIEILITDGEPNSTDPSSNPAITYCGVAPGCFFGATNPPNCIQHGERYAVCNLGKTTTFVTEINKNGRRDPAVDAYTVTVSEDVSTRIKDMLARYSTKSYDATDASDLSEILQDLFGDIISDYSRISFGKITPTP